MKSIKELLEVAGEYPTEAEFYAQVQACKQRTTKSNKPYYELTLVDALSQISLKVWNNHQQFDLCANLAKSTFLKVSGNWTQNQYGLDAPDWNWKTLQENEVEEFLTGSGELAEKQRADWKSICQNCDDLTDPRLKSLCALFISQFGDKFKRAAAAKKNHHARRGGLVEHVAYMMNSAKALCTVYPELNEDLIVAGVLFHDCGKMWENNYGEQDFTQNVSLAGECLGHINLGIELVNKLWKDLAQTESYQEWKHLSPSSELIKLHLLHLIASHHGTLEFGSPVVPKTPEAFTLHYIDNLDAKLEMVRKNYEEGNVLSSYVTEKTFPLPGNLITPLEHFNEQ